MPHDAHAQGTASPWIARFAHLVPAGGRVLDVACGRGRHVRLFAARGHRVVAVDRDREALAPLGEIALTVCADIEAGAWPFAGERFEGIVVANYLHRPLLPALAASLAPAGALLYETFARGHEVHGRPSRPEFLLARDELLDWAKREKLTVVAFEQGEVRDGDHAAVVQRLAAIAPGGAWPPDLGR